MQRVSREKESPAAANGGAYQDRARRNVSTASRRRQVAAKAPPVLSPDDHDALRRLTAAARHVLHLALKDTPGRKELLRAAFNVAEQATVWHRRIEPQLYARELGDRP